MMSLLLLAVSLALSSASRAAENPGVSGAPILQVPMGSRALGMGGAFSAVANDASALYYNPAGLSRLNAHELGFSWVSGQADNNIQQICYAGPIGFTGLSGNGYSSLGSSLLLAQNGTIEVNRTNADGSFLDTRNISAGSDIVLSLGYSERVGSTPLEFKGATYGINHFMGVSGKYLRTTLAEEFTAQAFAGDAGYLVSSPESGFSGGLAMLNLGNSVKFIEQSDPLPLTARIGAAYQGGAPSAHSFTLALDGEYLLNEKLWHLNTGFEYFWMKNYGLRLGYQFNRDAVGLTMGFGVRWRGRLVLDYAWALGNGLSDSHRFTVSYLFGGVTPATRGRQRRPFIESSPEKDQLKGVEDEKPVIEMVPQRRRALPGDQKPGVPGWIY